MVYVALLAREQKSCKSCKRTLYRTRVAKLIAGNAQHLCSIYASLQGRREVKTSRGAGCASVHDRVHDRVRSPEFEKAGTLGRYPGRPSGGVKRTMRNRKMSVLAKRLK